MKLEIRNDSVEVSGYVNAVGRDSRPLHDRAGYFIEQIEPGAFMRSLRRKSPVMLLNHDKAHVLATAQTGLEVREDAVGLYARAEITDKEVVEKARAGKLSGWSFGFNPISRDEGTVDGMRHYKVRDLDLVEISLLDDTKTPAYIATSVMTRDDGQDDGLQVREMPDDVEVRTVEPEPAASGGDEGHAEADTPLETRVLAVEALSRMWQDN